MASFVFIPLIFASALGLLYLVTLMMPENCYRKPVTRNIQSQHIERMLKFPSNLEELRVLAAFLQQYKSDHIGYVFLLFSCAYLFKQSFAIPGSVFLNLLAGALFGIWVGFPLTCLLTAFGATFCYILSDKFGKSLVNKYFPEKVTVLKNKIQSNTNGLFCFLLFLRLFPMSPNWFLNIACPLVDIPIKLFFFSALFGLMPYNYLCVQVGCVLSELTSVNDIFTWWTFLKLFSIAIIALFPAIYLRMIRLQPHPN